LPEIVFAAVISPAFFSESLLPNVTFTKAFNTLTPLIFENSATAGSSTFVIVNLVLEIASVAIAGPGPYPKCLLKTPCPSSASLNKQTDILIVWPIYLSLPPIKENGIPASIIFPPSP